MAATAPSPPCRSAASGSWRRRPASIRPVPSRVRAGGPASRPGCRAPSAPAPPASVPPGTRTCRCSRDACRWPAGSSATSRFGFSMKRSHALHTPAHRRQRLGRRDPAEAGLRPRRGDAEGDQPALRPRPAQRRRSAAWSASTSQHQMVGRADPQDASRARTRPAACSAARATAAAVLRADGSSSRLSCSRGSIAWYWRRISTRLAGRGHRDHPLRRRHGERPPHRGLQQRLLAEQLDQMLGEGRPAHRPQPGAGPAGQDGGGEVGGEAPSSSAGSSSVTDAVAGRAAASSGIARAQ